MAGSALTPTPTPSLARDQWSSRLGLILAMAGNAVGLGNFLRFPSQAAANGGGTFMIPYFVSLLLLGLPLMWIEWGLGRHGGRYGKGHLPGMFAVVWRHPAAKYLGVLGLVIPLVVVIYYTYLTSWTLAFTLFSLVQDYWGRESQEAMVAYLRSFQGVSGVEPAHPAFLAPLFFLATLGLVLRITARGISSGIERLARVGMPLLFLFAVVLAVAVLLQPAGPGGDSPLAGLQFIYAPDLSRLGEAGIWLAAAGQVFFTLSVGMGSLQTYASYLSRKDDLVLNGIATASVNETAEVVLGSTIAIPAAVTFFGVSGAMAIAQSGSFNLGFATMPVVFQQMPGGPLLGALWFGLLFLAGLTSAVAMLTPLLAFLQEEFRVPRAGATQWLGVVVLGFGLMHVAWLEHGFLDEWDYWGGTFGLVVFAAVEVLLFLWLFGSRKAWASLHEGADVRLPEAFRWVMTFVTPAFLFLLLGWWGITEALPILRLERAAGGGQVAPESLPYVLAARGFLLLFALVGVGLVAWAWRRNGYDDRRPLAGEDA